PEAAASARPAPRAPVASQRREDRGVVGLMFGAGIVFALTWSAASAFVVPIRGTREFGLTRGGISWLLGMAQTIDLVALIPVRRLAARVGYGLVLGSASVMLGLGTLGVGLGSFPWFALGTACLGAGLAAWMLPLGVIRGHTPVDRLAWRTGLYRVGVDAAIFLGPLAVGLLGAGGEPIFLTLVGVGRTAPTAPGRMSHR